MDISALTDKIIVFFILFVGYWGFYAASRYRRKTFWLNLMAAVLLTCLYWSWFLYPVVGKQWYWQALLGITILAAVLHHSSILSGRQDRKTRAIHGVISHALYFLPTSVVGTSVTIKVLPNLSTTSDKVVWLSHLLIILVTLIGGLRAGFKVKEIESAL